MRIGDVMIEAKVRERFENVALLVLKTDEGAKSKERWWPQESGKSEGTDSPLEPQEGILCSADTLT